MTFLPMPEIETDRLLLRQARMEDLPAYHQHLTSDPEVARCMLWEASPEISHAREAIARIQAGYKAGTRYHWAIARKDTDQFLGTIALLGFDEDSNSCSFAYMLGRAFWGMGYGGEALAAVLDFAFGEMGVSSVSADHFAENPASGAVMRKAGMRQIGTIPGKYLKDGIHHDAVLYRILREDWMKRR